MLPMIILIFSILFRMPIKKALIASLTIGIGFIGVFTFFDFFVATVGPTVEALIGRTGLDYNILDAGWPPMAAITWSYKLAPLLLILILLLNVIMLVLKLTDTVNVDIWNYWHFIFVGALVYETRHSILLSIAAALVTSVIIVKFGDWSTGAVKRLTGLSGISITTLSAAAYYPYAVIGDKLLDKLPGIRKLNADPESIKKKLGIFGEPMVIGFIMGLLLGIGAGYDMKRIMEVAFKLGAVVYILPLMCGVLSKGLIPISESIQNHLKNKYPQMTDKYIGLDVAVIVGNPSVTVTSLLLMPIAFALAFIIPGVGFIPLGDLPYIVGSVALVVVATKGNIIRSIILSIPIIIGKLLIATTMAEQYTKLAQAVNFKVSGYSGIFTSFLDGGNILRYWIVKVFSGSLIAIVMAIIIISISFILWRRHTRA
jgi:PTS system galactitol-specific IIC component